MPSSATPLPFTPAAQPAAKARPASSGAGEAFAALLNAASEGEAALQANPAEGQTASAEGQAAAVEGQAAPVTVDPKPEPGADIPAPVLAALPADPGSRPAGEPTPDAPSADTELFEMTPDLIGEEADGALDPNSANLSDPAVTDGERSPIAQAMTGKSAAPADDVTARVEVGVSRANSGAAPVDAVKAPADPETTPADGVTAAADAVTTPADAETTSAGAERAAAEIKSQATAIKSDPAPARDAPEIKAKPAAKTTGIESQPAQSMRQFADTADVDTVTPDVADKAANQVRSLDVTEDMAQALAPLKEARPATERTPGELLRGEIRDARGAAAGVDGKPDAKAVMADAKAPSGHAAQAPQATATAPAPPPASALPALETTPAFELLLAQMNGAAAAEPVLADAPVDPVLTKSDMAFDPAGLRLDARQEMRAASTLQFAQGPRLTPQSAQAMAAQIAQRFNEGSRIFDIRMDPPELGRVEVRLEVGSDNSVRALLAAERTETLAELQRSARDLERALAEAGLELGEGALSFSLTDDEADADDFGDQAAPDQPVFVNGDARLDPLAGPLEPLSTYGFLLTRAEGLDVSV